MFVEYNPNPVGNNVGDCVIRAITKAMGKSWEDTYIDIVVQGFLHSDMPSSNHVWDAYLRDNGFSTSNEKGGAANPLPLFLERRFIERCLQQTRLSFREPVCVSCKRLSAIFRTLRD